MNAITLEAQALAKRCIELDRQDGDKRARLARRAQVSPGTVENSLRGRLKAKAAWLVGVYQRVLITELEKEAAALAHEIETLRITASRPDSDEIFEAMASLQKVRQTLDRAKG
jgi:hypothetical protein